MYENENYKKCGSDERSTICKREVILISFAALKYTAAKKTGSILLPRVVDFGGMNSSELCWLISFLRIRYSDEFTEAGKRKKPAFHIQEKNAPFHSKRLDSAVSATYS